MFYTPPVHAMSLGLTPQPGENWNHWDGKNDGKESGHRCKNNNCIGGEHQCRITREMNNRQNLHTGYVLLNSGDLVETVDCKCEEEGGQKCLDFVRLKTNVNAPAPKPLVPCSVPCKKHSAYRCNECDLEYPDYQLCKPCTPLYLQRRLTKASQQDSSQS